ncbi:AbrB/MazE/SpoVT family DNA-binding domain-containing protein [Paenibacillus xylanilyticus]|uniref:AbrB/MazE/SpoVT family DNA-binding domain-containing protein n=1 Tax=Paenibacillus xylanilyticus TaxID=248903 RepID=A0A7Y6BS64_9BACL|nr:AbrB/MazE/SpoVT family DNA-binding domain-containing protein [Paenibacillus xylanilyticus]NUU73964.1 AbrB/MazE/SpoVT family DNA-binding domain-containing protein [Paenibacillus xylanilyticus]
MKRTGMKRSLDRLGRIVLPKEMRDTMQIDIGDPLEFFIEGKELILRKYKSTMCVFCGYFAAETYYKEQFVCSTCATQLKHPDKSSEWFLPESEYSPTPGEKVISESIPASTTQLDDSATNNYSDVRPKTARLLQQLKETMEQHPGLAQNQIALKLGISQGRVSQLKKMLP